MKAKIKTKDKIKSRSNVSRKNARSVVLVHENRPVLRRFRLIDGKHTGKLVHHRHSSYAVLIIVLMIVGLFLFAHDQSVQANTSGSVTVGTVVPGPAPSEGASILVPEDGAEFFDEESIEVSGVCEKETFVVVKNNGSVAGSTNCTEAGIFGLEMQLSLGKNVISALNYDNLNQAGPVTPSVTVYLLVEEVDIIEDITKLPSIPDNPSIINGLEPVDSMCSGFSTSGLVTGGQPKLSTVCVPRLFLPNITYQLGFLVWGGSPPYAVDIDWGDESENTLLSVSKPSYQSVNFSYAVLGVYKVVLKIRDNEGRTSFIQTSLITNGSSNNTSSGSVIDIVEDAIEDIVEVSWFKTPVPFYLIALAVTIGFWCGDLFDRRFGNRVEYNKKHKKAW